MSQGKKILFTSAIVFVSIYFLIAGLAGAKSFLAPLLTAIILAVLSLPLTRLIQKTGIGKGLASFITTFLLFLFTLGFIWIISLQVRIFIQDWPEIKETMTPKIEDFKSFIFKHTPLSESDLDSSMKGDGLPFIGSFQETGALALGFFSKTLSFMGTYLLVFIYIFFLLAYRAKFKKFIVLLFPDEHRKEVEKISAKSATVVQQYLIGRLLLMLFLGIVYSIGLGFSGVDNFLLVSIIAALLTIIPVVGNIIGFALAMALGYLTTGETSALIGIVVTFSIAQLLEDYVLQPFIIGDKVDLHPFFVILVVILGSAVWGVIGMILSIPILAIFTIIALNVPSLYPFGYLFSKNNSKKNGK